MIVYCCRDLVFATKIRSTAQSLGLATRPARDAATLQARLDRVDDGKGHDPVRGVIVDLDLEDAALALLEQVRRHDADLPLVAFGSHVAADLLAAARDRGAHFVLARSAFSATLLQLLQRIGGEPA